MCIRDRVECERVLAENQFLVRKATARTDERVKDELSTDKLKTLLKHAREKLLRADGEFLWWTEFRPAHRDRAEWSDVMWEALEHDDDVETHEEEYRGQNRRKERIVI